MGATERNVTDRNAGASEAAVIPDMVTFFGPRSTRPGRCSIRGHHYAFWLRSQPDLEDVGQGSVEQLRETLRFALENGGVLVEIRPHDNTIAVDGREGNGYRPPQKMLQLPAVGQPLMVPIGKEINYQPGDHFVVPVDADSLAKLYSFEELLQLLPLEQERNILDVLRKPQLELRLQLLEWRLSGTLPEAARRQSAWSRIRRSLTSRRAQVWWLLALLAVTLTALRLYMPHWLQGLIPPRLGGDTTFVVLLGIIPAALAFAFHLWGAETTEDDGVE
jgi:hypothetical protein